MQIQAFNKYAVLLLHFSDFGSIDLFYQRHRTTHLINWRTLQLNKPLHIPAVLYTPEILSAGPENCKLG